MIDLILKVNGVDYTLSDIAKFYSIAEIAQKINLLQTQAQTEIANFAQQLNAIEPDQEKQQLAVQIVLAVRQQLPITINI
jgi:hypothetical protein